MIISGEMMYGDNETGNFVIGLFGTGNVLAGTIVRRMNRPDARTNTPLRHKNICPNRFQCLRN